MGVSLFEGAPFWIGLNGNRKAEPPFWGVPLFLRRANRLLRMGVHPNKIADSIDAVHNSQL